MKHSRPARRLLIAALALVSLCVGCAAPPPAATPTPAPSPTAGVAATATPSQAFQASVVAAVQATSSAVTLSPTPTPLAFADLAPFRHQPTGLVGLMPASWKLEDAADGFVIRPGSGRQGSFTVTLTDTSKLPAGEPERLTRALFDRLRQPGLFITEDHLAPDGTGRLTLIGDPGLTTYAWARQTDRGLLTVTMIVPTQQREWESQSIERMLGSVDLAGDTLSSVACRHSFTQHPVTAEDDWFVPQEQRGDLFDPTVWYDGPVGFFGSSIADFNGDGRQDLALASDSSPDEPRQLYILLQSPAGALGAPTCFSIAGLLKTMATGDLNGDGRDDVVLGGMDPKIDLFLSADHGLFGERRSLATESNDIFLVTVADLNSDGRDDVAAISWEKPVADLFLQQEGGDLAPMISFPINRTSVDEMAMADVNGDKLPDMIQHSGQTDSDLQIFLQRPDHTFADGVEYRSSYRSECMAVGDVTGDKRNDIVLSVANNTEGDRLLIFEQGDGDVLLERASYPLYRRPEAVKIADFNGDGRNDVAVFHADEQVLSVLLQQADATLAAGTLYANLSAFSSAEATSVGDLNGDGRPDIVAAGRGFSVFYARRP